MRPQLRGGPASPQPPEPGPGQPPQPTPRRAMWLVELPYVAMFLLGVLIYGSALGVLLGEWAVKSS